MNDPQSPPRTEAELRTIAMPADTNRFGDIFGGWLLAQMDLAGGSYAMARAGGRVATVGIEAMSFHRPVYVGDRVSCHCRTERIGRTSITVHVETWVRRTRRAGRRRRSGSPRASSPSSPSARAASSARSSDDGARAHASP